MRYARLANDAYQGMQKRAPRLGVKFRPMYGSMSTQESFFGLQGYVSPNSDNYADSRSQSVSNPRWTTRVGYVNSLLSGETPRYQVPNQIGQFGYSSPVLGGNFAEDPMIPGMIVPITLDAEEGLQKMVSKGLYPYPEFLTHLTFYSLYKDLNPFPSTLSSLNSFARYYRNAVKRLAGRGEKAADLKYYDTNTRGVPVLREFKDSEIIFPTYAVLSGEKSWPSSQPGPKFEATEMFKSEYCGTCMPPGPITVFNSNPYIQAARWFRLRYRPDQVFDEIARMLVEEEEARKIAQSYSEPPPTHTTAESTAGEIPLDTVIATGAQGPITEAMIQDYLVTSPQLSYEEAIAAIKSNMSAQAFLVGEEVVAAGVSESQAQQVAPPQPEGAGAPVALKTVLPLAALGVAGYFLFIR